MLQNLNRKIMITFLIIIITFLASYNGFKSIEFFENYKFEVDRILIFKQYKRLITSGFLHSGWWHLIFNMLALYSFGSLLEFKIGAFNFLLLYFISKIGGSLLMLFIHRNHGDYSAIGASGAVSGVVFASIAVFPDIEVGFILPGLSIPGWIYAILFILISIYGIKSQAGNIGHEAHLGGSFAGLVLGIVFVPTALENNYFVILTAFVPTILFLSLIIFRPQILLFNTYGKRTSYKTIDEKYNAAKVNKENEIDAILDKINKKGINSLSTNEKEKLDKYSRVN